MLYFYLIVSGIALPVINSFYEIFGKSYSWVLVPLLWIVIFLTLVILQILLMLLAFQIVNPNSPREKGTKFYRFIVKHTLPLMLFLAKVRVNKTGIDPEDLPKDKRMLFVCNHQHNFDPVIMFSVFPDSEIGFIGKKDIYKTMPLIGKAMHKLYGLAIDRENDREAAKTIIEASRILKDDKASIGLFPEGYTSKQCELLPFRNGAFKIALKAKVPVVVCVINNTRAIPKRMLWTFTKVDFKIVDVINPEDYEGLNTTGLGDIIHEKMEVAYNEIRNK